MAQLIDLELLKPWEMLFDDFGLVDDTAASKAKGLPQDSGVYLWTMRYNDKEPDHDEYALYVGKAKMLSRRIYNYTQSFQPHSPNDRKLYFAQIAIIQKKPKARFLLYWKKVPIDQLNTAENNVINEFKPVLNDRRAYSPEYRNSLEKVYSELYRDVIAKHVP